MYKFKCKLMYNYIYKVSLYIYEILITAIATKIITLDFKKIKRSPDI